ncbi:adult-specific cuticular protein ACP-20-like [Diabrotica virgifera virgifera]|uniref:Adult-specific cuticular protein ACP-20-like n=1 Tax=Diabrotica virgifera virgifera TaxID=50390 RepID=A0A6P7F6Y2_DIAVI|nr:adult-specific cuticular protein ACP-20-like [Diabrotica virgifera virgifera]
MQIFIVYVAAIAAVAYARPGGDYGHLELAGGYEDGGHYGGHEATSYQHGGLIANEIGHGDEGHHEEHVDYHAPAKYHYDYAVHDLHTHDIKSQWETRNGDKVKGEYTVVEPDGSRRIVSYTADKHTGFHAVVKNVHDY